MPPKKTGAVPANRPEPVADPESVALGPTLEDLILQGTELEARDLDRARRVGERLKEPRPLTEILVELGKLTRVESERILKLYRTRLDVAGILREEGTLSEAGLLTYRETKAKSRARSDRDILVGDQLVTEEQFLRALCEKHGLSFQAPQIALLDDKLLEKVSIPFLARRKVLPLSKVDGEILLFVNDPLDTNLIREFERIYKCPARILVCTAAAIETALNRAVKQSQPVGEDGDAPTIKYREIKQIEDGDEIGVEAVRIVDSLLYKAIELGASDLHIEPGENQVHVRVRVDGVMSSITEFPADFAPRVASRIKVLCSADLAERRLHQDGRIFVRVGGREVDLRVSTYASVFGETIVIRILDRSRGLVPLESLGFESGILRLLREVVLRSPAGLCLVTGPTGSGKTTTLYSFVDHLQDGKSKIITAEDPVEYVLQGTTQCSVNNKTGPTFPDSLRAMLRQDPDVIVVGEIRDQITASLAVESALTGHKVYSTFHTEDAVSAVVRLLEMGVEPFLVASTVNCVIAQRLARRVCGGCQKQVSASKGDLRYLDVAASSIQGILLTEGTGCAKCDHRGFKGRAGIHEVLVPDDDFRDAIMSRASSKELRRLAKKLPGFLSLQEDGLLKVAAGTTSLSEIADHVPRDVHARELSELKQIASRRSY